MVLIPIRRTLITDQTNKVYLFVYYICANVYPFVYCMSHHISSNALATTITMRVIRSQAISSTHSSSLTRRTLKPIRVRPPALPDRVLANLFYYKANRLWVNTILASVLTLSVLGETLVSAEHLTT